MEKITAYNYIGKLDIASWYAKISKFAIEEWLDYNWRQKRFDVHRHTETIPLIFNEEFDRSIPTQREKYNYFLEEIKQLEHLFKNFYGQGFIVRLIIVKMLSNATIPTHTDRGNSLTIGRRHHIPIITNDNVIFTVGGESKYMKLGEIWEINNQLPHAVVNHGDKDRVHLIADWITKKNEKN